MDRFIKKYDYSAQIMGDISCGNLSNPYVASYNGNIDWNSIKSSNNTFLINYKQPFSIQNANFGEEITLSINSAYTQYGFYYSFDTGETKTWNEYTGEITLGSLLSNTGRVYLKSNLFNASGIRSLFKASGKYNAMGNIGSLFFGDNYLLVRDIENHTQSPIFQYDDKLKSAQFLVFNYDSYDGALFISFFDGCTSLEIAPQLMRLGKVGPKGRFSNVFRNCTSLYSPVYYLIIDEFSPETTALNQLIGIYSGCTSLNQIRFEIIAQPPTVTTNPMNGFSANVAATGTFYKNKNVTWLENGSNGIPIGWTVVDVE